MNPRAFIAILLCAGCSERADVEALSRNADSAAFLEEVPGASVLATEETERRELPVPASASIVVAVEAVLEIRPRKPPYLPQPGVLVEFGTRLGDEVSTTTTAGTWRTGDDGWIDALIEAPDVEGPVWIWARPIDDGWQQRRVLALVEDNALPKPLAIHAIPGFTVRGSLANEQGAPVPGSLIQWVDGRTRAHFEIPASGEFEWHLGRAETCTLSVVSEGHGTALFEVSLDALRAADPLDIVVRGPGALGGRVVDEDGRAHPGLGLLVVAWGVDGVDVARPSAWGPFRKVAAGGLRTVRVRTDEDGRFSVQGLALGPFRVRADVLGRGRYDAILTETPVNAGTRGLELTVRAPRVSVQVVDVDGAALPFVPLAGRQDLGNVEWPDGVEHVVFVRRSDGAGVEDTLGYDPWRNTASALHGELQLEPDTHYLVTLATLGGPVRSEQLYVDPRGRAAPLRLSALPQTGAGRLRLRVRAPLTAPTERSGGRLGGLEGFDLRMRTLESGVGVLAARLSLTEPFESVLPPGSYELEIEPVGTLLMCGTGTDPDDFEVLPRPDRRTVEVLSGELLDLDFELEPAAQFYLRASLPAAWTAAAPEVRLLASNAAGEERALTFWSSDAFSLDDLDFDSPGDGSSSPADETTEYVRAGDWRTARELLAPGVWSLRAEGGGLVAGPVEVTLGHGERQRVELELRAK